MTLGVLAVVADRVEVPLPSTTGVPRSWLRAVTLHSSIVSPAGGATSAVTAVGAVTFEPSTGVTWSTVGS